MRPHDDEGKSDVCQWWNNTTASFFEADDYDNASVETSMARLAIDTAAARLLEPPKKSAKPQFVRSTTGIFCKVVLDHPHGFHNSTFHWQCECTGG